jgi:hypothetical protein
MNDTNRNESIQKYAKRLAKLYNAFEAPLFLQSIVQYHLLCLMQAMIQVLVHPSRSMVQNEKNLQR